MWIIGIVTDRRALPLWLIPETRKEATQRAYRAYRPRVCKVHRVCKVVSVRFRHILRDPCDSLTDSLMADRLNEGWLIDWRLID